MTGTVLDYLMEYGDVSFAEMRFTEVDAAILSKLSYFNFEGIVPTPEQKLTAVSLKNIMLMENHEDIFNKGKYESVHRELVELMLKGKRFADLRIACYENCFDRESQTQFAAVTFLVSPRRMCVVFRGTDSTVVGLKEDLNLLYMDEAPCHKMAIEYLKMISERYARKIYLAGHSKGGHLALYAAMYMPPEIKDRIHRIYSLDGLGLRPSTMERGNFSEIEKKIYKLVPQSSLIGMMLDDVDTYEVVRSTGVSLIQHNIYTWIVEGKKFAREEKLGTNALFVEHSFNGWVDSQDDENRRKFIDGVYSVIDALEAEKLGDILAGGGKKFNKILSEIKGLDPETADQIKTVFKAFIEVTKFYLKEDVGGNLKDSTSAAGERLKETTNAAGAKLKKIIRI